MILVIDNYDSFTYNLVQMLGSVAGAVEVRRNDACTVAQLRALRPQGIVISPGPGRPEDAGVTVPLIRQVAGQIPVLGICLGHQALAVAFGGRVALADRLVHGKSSPVHHRDRGLFAGCPNPFPAARYHSLIVADDDIPPDLSVTARSETGELMAVRHRRWPLYGLQFHPESVLTEAGATLLANFAALCSEEAS